MTTLTVMGMFRNESHIINEWIEHYRNEGATKIILINHHSSDDWRSSIKKEDIDSGFVTLLENTYQGQCTQTIFYNSVLKKKIFDTDWLLTCDLDEFIYARRNFKTITEYLDTLEDDVSQVAIPWKVFGSSGHIDIPESAIQSYRHWNPTHDTENPVYNKILATRTYLKNIVRVKDIKQLGLHSHTTKSGVTITSSDKRTVVNHPDPKDKLHGTIVTYDVSNDNIHCNHYYTQSLEYYKKVQSKRGGGQNPRSVKTLVWFDKNKDGKYYDDELANKTYE